MPRYRLSCPACPFEETVDGTWQSALACGDEHVADCGGLPSDSVVTLERIDFDPLLEYDTPDDAPGTDQPPTED